MRISAITICHKNQKDDTLDKEKERDEAASRLLRQPLRFAQIADLL